MQPDTPLIDFFRRVYAPLKLVRRRSQVQRCQRAIDALTASMGHRPSIGDLVRLDPSPPDLATLRAYLIELEVRPTAAKPAYFAVVHRGKEVLVPNGAPTPQEIEERCAAIRAEWSEGEKRVRAGFKRYGTRWLPPGCQNHSPET